MTFYRVKFFVLFFCATTLVGVSAYAASQSNFNSTVRIGIFNSHKTAQKFFEALPAPFQSHIDTQALWLNAYQSASGLTEYYLDIANLKSNRANDLCIYLEKKDVQCIISERQLLVSNNASETEKRSVPTLTTKSNRPLSIFKPLGLQLHDKGTDSGGIAFNPSLPSSIGATLYDDEFSLSPHIEDTEAVVLAKTDYSVARDKFVTALQKVGEGVNDDRGVEALKETLSLLGREAFEAAGSAYLSGFLERHKNEATILSSDAGAGQSFVHHVKAGLSDQALSTVQSLVDQVLTSATAGESLSGDILTDQADNFILSGARHIIDSGLQAARRSDLYALRHLELEYNLNDFEDAYFSVLATQPIYQSSDVRHNVFVQGGGIINEKSVDIDDDTARHTANLGLAYRYLTTDEEYLLGGNVFFDHQWPYDHSRMSLGVDAQATDLNFAANYYIPLSGYKDSRRDSSGIQYEERALEGYNVELGYTLPALPELSIFGKGYQYFRETDDDLRGLELSAEYDVRKDFTIKGSVIEENGGRDGVELVLQYRTPLYNTNKPNLAVAAVKDKIKNPSLRSKIFSKVRRENRIRVEERVKVGALPPLSAQFSALSTGLPFSVGGTATAALVDLAFDTSITIPNGDFAILNFSDGAIANVSASGGGDVILEFNATTLTVTATNGGFVQYISGTGGISIVNVPGGTVNLLGTDIDVTDNGTITTVQVRAGQIEVVPDVGAAVLNGNQADVISLGITTGATSLLVDPALEARQEAAFTNLDFINPDPPGIDTAAPFINALPTLITGPQFIGNNADLRVTFTQPVTVTGAPQITGFIDANARNFIYETSASTPTQLVFRHVYIASDVGAVGITAQDLDLNGGTITGSTNGLNAVTAFTDTVIPIIDQTDPMLLSSTPADDEPAFNGGANIVLNFDENMQANVGNITLTDTTDGSSTTIIPITDVNQVTISGSTVTINPTGILDLTTDYDLTVGANVIQDTSGNPFAGIASGELNFTTSNDVTPPTLTSTIPADDATEVARSADIVLNFDDNAVIGSGNITIHRSADNAVLETISVGSANITGSGTATITINPTTDFPAATDLYILIPSSAFADINGNDFAGLNAPADLSFRTFSPLDLSNITLWLDGEDIDADGVPEGTSEAGLVAGNVATWADKSGNNNDTIQTNAGIRPSFANPGANFVGTTNSVSNGDFMSITNGGASGQTVVAVLEGVAQNVSGQVNAFLDSAGRDYSFLRVAATDYKISLDGAIGRQGRVAFDGDNFSASGGNVAPPGPFPTDALLYTEYATVPTDHETLGGLSTNDGAVVASPAFRSNFVLREIIMYSNVKTSDLAGIDEREKIEGYLAHKYGITARLPSAHPFRAVAP